MLEEVKFENLYYSYNRLVSFIISKYVKNILDVEELTNDVFIKFSQVYGKEHIKNNKQYLIVAAKNTAINFVKKQENKYIIYNEELVDYSKDLKDDYAYYSIINDMLSILTLEEVNIILLHVVYDYSFKEIARKYNYTISKTKAMYYKAKQQIINKKSEE